MILIKCMRNSFEGDLYSSDCLMWIFWKRSNNLIKYTANLPNRLFVKKNNHRNSYFQHRKIDKKSSTFCVKNLSIEYPFFFKWVWKVTKSIRQLIFHRIWKNMYQYILFSRSPYGWFSKYDRKEFNTLHSVYEWGHQRWNLWKEKSRFIYLLVLKHNRPHYWTKNV